MLWHHLLPESTVKHRKRSSPMYPVKIQHAGKSLWLFPNHDHAETARVQLARGALERFEVQAHPSGLGHWIKDKETGRFFDSQGMFDEPAATLSAEPSSPPAPSAPSP